MIGTQISNLCLVTMVEHITETMMTNPEDPYELATKVDLVKMGLLQTSKTQLNIQIGITGGDHENPEYRDGIATLDDLPKIGFRIDPREIGGTEMWFRRFVARIECYFIVERFTEVEAHAAGYSVLGKLMEEIPLAPVNGLVDSYGEKAIKAFVYANTFFESGGPPKSFIFRGKVLWQVLTERP